MHIYLELLYLLGGWTLHHYIIFLPSSSNFLCSEVYSIWFLYGYSHFHLIHVGMIYILFILLLSTCLCVHVSIRALSCVWLFATLWIAACRDPLSMEFSRQEYWSSFPFPTPEDLPDPGIKHTSLASPALAGRFSATSATWETPLNLSVSVYLKWVSYR